MKLFYTKGACSFAVRIIINEIGLKVDYESVNLETKKTETGAHFLQINPKGSVPVLEIETDTFLTENAVILQYLADKHQATNLLPEINDIRRYRVLEWLHYIATELHKSLGPLFHVKEETVRNQFLIPLIESKLNFINDHLQDRSFIYGEDFTLADAYLFVILTWTAYFKFDPKKWPHLTRYFNEQMLRPSIQKSLKEESSH